MTKGKSAKAPGDAIIGAGGELHQQAGDGAPLLTTNHGVPISDDQNSLRAGVRGPTLLEDAFFREKIFHFDHERIPERIVHARGSGAHGVFELTKSLAKYTRAKVLTEVGARTELFLRFSTVAGGAGSVDTPRDVRGFAVKMYTTEGNWDLVGNNIPVFFIQDAIKFPDLIHSVKMEADKGYPQAGSAHDTFWDFVSLMPESMHTLMWAMSDRAIPRSLRMMEGFGVHTFRLLNDKDEETLVKFHWRPKLGLRSHVWNEAVKVAGADNDYHRRDLYEAIASGDFPQWDLGVQLFTRAQADKMPFDVFDPTKLIPEEMIPVEIVGVMTLNRNPDNFFAETEQVAFLPSNLPPGIDVSEDPLLQGRLFSYQDTQLSRLGSTNFHQIPVNAARGCPFGNFQRDGHMQVAVPRGRANYEPNSLADAGEDGGPRESQHAGFRTYPEPMSGEKVRLRRESFADHYSQPRLFYRSQSTTEQNHMVAAMVFELSKVTLAHVRKRVIGRLRNIDEAMAKRVADGLGLDALPPLEPPAAPVKEMKPSPALRLIDKYPASLKGGCVGVLVGDGADGALVKTLKAAVEKAGARAKIIAKKVGGATLKDGSKLPADAQLDGSPSALYDAVAIISGKEGVDLFLKDAHARDFVGDAFSHLKAIAFSKEVEPLLKKADVVPDASVVDAGAPDAFVKKAGSREWAREPSLRPPV